MAVYCTYGGAFHQSITLEEAIAKQYPTDPECFVCETCVHHRGGCKCARNVFIAFVGGNMRGCWGYERKPEESH